MKNQLFYWASLVMLFIITFHLQSCKEEIEDFNSVSYLNYFPMDSGFWIIYDIDSVIYSKFLENGKATRRCQLKEVYTNIFTDNEGRLAVRIERYIRYNPLTNWDDIVPTVWYAVRDSQRAERMEGDLRFMKLVFPMYTSRTWAGNTYLDVGNPDLGTYANWSYRYEAVDAPFTVADTTLNGQVFSHALDSTANILQQDNSNLVDKVYSREVYARNIGLIYKEQWILNLGGKDISSPETWPNRAEKGFITVYNAIDWKQ